MDPVAKANLRSIMYRNDPSGYKTTYGTSYLDVPTYYVSPVYDKMREEREREPYPRDLSPYPNQRFDGTFNDYLAKREDERREMERRERERRDVEERYRREMELRQTERRESPDRRMPRDDSPQRNPYRDPYEEPLSHRSRYDQFENGYQRANGFQEAPLSYRQGQQEQISSPRKQKFQEEHLRPDLRPEEQQEEKDDLDLDVNERRFCNQCFATNICVNKFKCGHQYCDQCMKRLRGSENPFRGSWIWHFKCGICKTDEWCSEHRLIRYDAKGRRIPNGSGFPLSN